MTAQMISRPAPDTHQHQVSSPSLLSSLLVWCFVFLLAAWAISELKAPNAVPASAPQNEFSAERALTHVRAIARVPHPIGSHAGAEAREYLVAQLSALGMSPQVVMATGIYNGSGALIAGNTHDVVARLPGTANSGAIVLMAHYDSVPSGPGAADDAAGVAAVLEAVRALKTGPSLKNDLIVLITDGEEAGLLGAEAYAASHPEIKDSGLIMNFEARGNRGPSLLFETSKNNGALINEVAKAAPYPTGSSLFYALYKLLPNDTDFSVFRPAGTPGLNFAFGGHLEAYHSWLDTPDNLDTASLQHHGSYALALARHFGQMDLTKVKQQTGDNVFFDWLGSNLLTYSERWVMIGEGIATILLILVIVLSVRRTEVQMGSLLLAVFVCLVVFLIIPATMSAAGWLLLRLLGSRLLFGDTPANSFLLIGLTLLGATMGCAVLGKLRRRFNLQELSLAGLVVVCILSWTIALLLPAGSYLLFWPLLLSTIGLLMRGLINAASPHAQMLLTLPGTVIAILLFAPVAYLLYVFLSLNVLSLAAVGLLLGLFFCACLPLIGVAAPQSSWRAIILPLIGAAICLGVGIVQSHPSALHPRRDTLLYSLNADDHTAIWASYDDALDAFTTQVFGGKTATRKPMPDFLAGSQRPVLSGPAPAVDLPPPISEIKADEQNGETHNIRINVRSQRDAHLILVRFDPSVKPISVKISGRNMNPRPNSTGLTLLLQGMDAQGADLELALKAPASISFWISDYSVGLPTTQRRGSELIAAQGSDETLVVRKYTLGKPAK
ncbi:MAG TPA: M20/M25/M40 family metallo-hydrolase [Candidatus Angelobacter sp.]|nr:M20/M25/M40 family metallo-hydrolase [Candidatus Angelobacter sp.]